jgi:hypothetical protein
MLGDFAAVVPPALSMLWVSIEETPYLRQTCLMISSPVSNSG